MTTHEGNAVASGDLRAQLEQITQRYPDARSALLPMLHLIQAEYSEITPDGIALCADVLGITAAEVVGVATFYTMYKRRPVGEHHIGVCTNTLCAMLGGDAVYAALSERLGVGHDESTSDGAFWLERIECQAACTHAPVMTVDWEFMDQVTPSSAVDIVDRLARGEDVRSTRGPLVRGFRATSHTLAFPDDGLAGEGPVADDLMLAGLRVAKERGMSAPAVPSGASAPSAGEEQ